MNQLNLFIELTRLKKPIGYMLLFWPCIWGLTLVYDFSQNKNIYFFYLILFFLGAVLMRSAGCIVNDVLEGTAAVAAGPTPPAFAWAYNNSLEPYPYNPEKARQLISEAGADGAELTFFVTEGGSGMLDPVAMGTAIQADLQAVGLKVNIETYEWNTFLGEVNPGLEGKADMAEMAWMTNDPDTLPFLALRTEAWPDKGGFNSGYYSNPKVDELLEAARASTDQSERARLYQEMQTIVQEDAPWVFVANWKQNAVTSDRVGSFSLQPSFFLLLNNVDKN